MFNYVLSLILGGEEVNLRQALLDFLDQRPRKGKGKGPAPLLGDVMNAPRVTQSRMALLPTNVSLKELLRNSIFFIIFHRFSIDFHWFSSIFLNIRGLKGPSLPFRAASEQLNGLQDWIEARIGAEVELRQNAQGRSKGREFSSIFISVYQFLGVLWDAFM